MYVPVWFVSSTSELAGLLAPPPPAFVAELGRGLGSRCVTGGGDGGTGTYGQGSMAVAELRATLSRGARERRGGARAAGAGAQGSVKLRARCRGKAGGPLPMAAAHTRAAAYSRGLLHLARSVRKVQQAKRAQCHWDSRECWRALRVRVARSRRPRNELTWRAVVFNRTPRREDSYEFARISLLHSNAPAASY